MNIQMNASNAASSIMDFVRQCGGTIKLAQAREFTAKLGGYTSYRAMRGAKQQATATSAKSTKPLDPRALESEQYVVHRSVAQDWRISDNGVSEPVPLRHQSNYDIIFEKCGSQYRLLVKPVDVNYDNYGNEPVLDLLVEINEGVPCVHLTNDPDYMLMSVFSTGSGLVVRSEGGNWTTGAARSAMPIALQDVIMDAILPTDRNEVKVILHENEFPQEKDASQAKCILPRVAQVPLTALGCAKQYFQGEVQVGFEVSESPKLALVVQLVDAAGATADDEYFSNVSVLDKDLASLTGTRAVQEYLAQFAQVVAYFIEKGMLMSDLKDLIEKLSVSQQPVNAIEAARIATIAAVDAQTALKVIKASL